MTSFVRNSWKVKVIRKKLKGNIFIYLGCHRRRGDHVLDALFSDLPRTVATVATVALASVELGLWSDRRSANEGEAESPSIVYSFLVDRSHCLYIFRQSWQILAGSGKTLAFLLPAFCEMNLGERRNWRQRRAQGW